MQGKDQPIPMAVFDCFTFFNEMDVLEIRLNEMASAVDTFVIAEAPWTFQGKPKPLYFDDNRARFRRFLPKIRHLVIEDQPDSDVAWHREFHQRNALKRGLNHANLSDTVIVSDVDEIVKVSAVRQAAATGAFVFLEMSLHYYFMDLKRTPPWIKPYAAPWSVVREISDISEPRMLELLYLEIIKENTSNSVLHNAGWHFSWLGGVPKIMDKLNAFSHTEEAVQRWADPEILRKEIIEQRFFYDGNALSHVALSELPRFVRQNAYRFHQAGLLTTPPRTSSLERLAQRIRRAIVRRF